MLICSCISWGPCSTIMVHQGRAHKQRIQGRNLIFLYLRNNLLGRIVDLAAPQPRSGCDVSTMHSVHRNVFICHRYFPLFLHGRAGCCSFYFKPFHHMICSLLIFERPTGGRTLSTAHNNKAFLLSFIARGPFYNSHFSAVETCFEAPAFMVSEESAGDYLLWPTFAAAKLRSVIWHKCGANSHLLLLFSCLNINLK